MAKKALPNKTRMAGGERGEENSRKGGNGQKEASAVNATKEPSSGTWLVRHGYYDKLGS